MGSTHAGVDPSLVAGKARDGGGARDSSSGDQMAGGGHLRRAGTRLHPFVQTAGAEVARARRRQARGGGWSSGDDANVAMVHGRSNGWLLWARGAVLSTVTRSVLSPSGCGDGGDGGDMAGGRKLSAPVKRTVRGSVR